MNEIKKQWVWRTLKESPKLYGGDGGNAAIITRYLIETANICDRCKESIKRVAVSATSITRLRRLILKSHPELDHRTIVNNGGHKGRQTTIEEFLNELERHGGDTIEGDCLDEVRRAARVIIPPSKGDKEVYHNGGAK